MNWGNFKKYLESKGVTDEIRIACFDVIACVGIKNLKIIIRKGSGGNFMTVSH